MIPRYDNKARDASEMKYRFTMYLPNGLQRPDLENKHQL